MIFVVFLFICNFVLCVDRVVLDIYMVDDSFGFGRWFDGIGGFSGGGVGYGIYNDLYVNNVEEVILLVFFIY